MQFRVRNFIQMNPYEINNHSVSPLEESHVFRRSRIAFWTTVAATAILLPLMAGIGMGALPFLMIPLLKHVDLDFSTQTLLLLFWTHSAPFFLGVSLYLAIRLGQPVDDGQRLAPNCEES